MNATATKTAAKPAITKTAAELKQEQANIIQSLADLTDVSKMEELMASLKAVKKQIADIEHERTGSLNEVSQSILIHSIKFSELTEAARQMLGAVVAHAAAPAAAKKSAGKGGTKPSFQGEVLIHVANGSRPAEYKKGQPQAQYVSGTFKKLYEDNKDKFEEALAPYIQEAGKVYFATEEGKAELARFVEFVKTKKVIPPAKKK